MRNKSFDKEKHTIEYLKEKGYCRVSNKYRIASRLDKKDWEKIMAKKHSSWDVEKGLSWVNSLGEGAEDHYRRCYSCDTIEGIEPALFKQLPTSSWTVLGYRES